ncbi:MAG: YraN family protein [Desulfovibrionales bacterium]
MVSRAMSLGACGEDVAADYMRENGYKVLERNWKCPRGELDIICSRGLELIFVEVKTRKKGGMARAIEALAPGQQIKLARAASIYLSRNGLWSRQCRFDLIALEVDANNVNLEHVPNAFDVRPSVGSSHSSWQPW